MKSIILHIEYLLQRTDCLTLPGIGALIAERIPARFDEEEGVIYPPMKHISLNTSIIHDDGTLATSIARAESIKFEEGRRVMQEMLSTLRESLQTEGEASLGKIGVLKVNEDDSISLLPFRSSNRFAADLGFKAAKLRSEKIVPEETESTVSIPVMEEDNSSANPDIEMRPFSRKNYYIPVNKIFAKCAASVVVLTIIALSFIMPQRNVINERISASMNPVETLMSNGRASREISTYRDNKANDSSSEEVSADYNQSEQSASAEDANDKISYNESPATGHNYLIVATFRTPAEAETFIEMRKGGNYPLSIVKGKNVWRISAGEGDRETLRAMLNTTEFRSAFAEAWIWSAE